ncbi:hypothetical protein V1477_018778 [Vespula maculifrons]|uniref:Uncharacterized protein n=1 Tax=Vespula maculifrons TaxID=7453 RepID=A0ABD2AWB7_VESMC
MLPNIREEYIQLMNLFIYPLLYFMFIYNETVKVMNACNKKFFSILQFLCQPIVAGCNKLQLFH